MEFVTFSAASRLLDYGLQRLKATEGSEEYKSKQEKAEHLAASWRYWESSWGHSGMDLYLPLKAEVHERLIPKLKALAAGILASSRESYWSSFWKLPPVTASLLLANVVAFIPGMVLWREACLSPYCIVEKQEYARLFLPALVHGGPFHLWFNLKSAILTSAARERQSGSVLFMLELTFLTALSHGLYVGFAWYQMVYMGKNMYYNAGAIGLSVVASALEVVVDRFPPKLFGLVPLPAKDSWPIVVLLDRVLSPDGAFHAHLCGIARGLLHSCFVLPVASFFHQLFRPPVHHGATEVWNHGTSRSTQITSSELVKWLKDTATQASLFGAVSGACVLVNRNGAMTNLHTFRTIMRFAMCALSIITSF